MKFIRKIVSYVPLFSILLLCVSLATPFAIAGDSKISVTYMVSHMSEFMGENSGARGFCTVLVLLFGVISIIVSLVYIVKTLINIRKGYHSATAARGSAVLHLFTFFLGKMVVELPTSITFNGITIYSPAVETSVGPAFIIASIALILIVATEIVCNHVLDPMLGKYGLDSGKELLGIILSSVAEVLGAIVVIMLCSSNLFKPVEEIADHSVSLGFAFSISKNLDSLSVITGEGAKANVALGIVFPVILIFLVCIVQSVSQADMKFKNKELISAEEAGKGPYVHIEPGQYARKGGFFYQISIPVLCAVLTLLTGVLVGKFYPDLGKASPVIYVIFALGLIQVGVAVALKVLNLCVYLTDEQLAGAKMNTSTEDSVEETEE